MYKQKELETKTISLKFLGSLLFCNGLLLLVLVSKAQAGGYEKPIPPPIAPSRVPANEKLPTLSLNWETWGLPYWLNNTICRETKGNIICLQPQLARQIRWEIPERNEGMNSN